MGLPPELRVLMATVRENPDALSRALGEEVRWPLLVHLAERERAVPVLHRCLGELGDDPRVPAEALDELRKRARVQDLRMLALERHLDHLLALYSGEGIDVVLLKGAALWRWVYSSPLDRPMNDLDLLVEPADAERAWKLARNEGWRWPEDQYPWEDYRGHHHLPPLADAAGTGLKLEIHSDILPPGHPFRFGGQAVWHEARPAPSGAGGRVPRAEHLLLHAALHFTWSHLFLYGAWRTFRDLDALVSSERVDWERFVDEAKKSGGAPAAFWTLYLARRWAAVPVTEEGVQGLRPRPSRLVRRPLARHFALRTLPAPAGAKTTVWLARRLWELAMRPRCTGSNAARPWDLGPAHRASEGSGDGSPPRARGCGTPGPGDGTGLNARGGRQVAGDLGYLFRLLGGR